MRPIIERIQQTFVPSDIRSREREFWVKDSECKACYECDRPFGLFLRKHHCRMCGGIHCDKCSNKQLPPQAFPHIHNVRSAQRVCNRCFETYQLRQNVKAESAVAGWPGHQRSAQHRSTPDLRSGAPWQALVPSASRNARQAEGGTLERPTASIAQPTPGTRSDSAVNLAPSKQLVPAGPSSLPPRPASGPIRPGMPGARSFGESDGAGSTVESAQVCTADVQATLAVAGPRITSSQLSAALHPTGSVRGSARPGQLPALEPSDSKLTVAGRGNRGISEAMIWDEPDPMPLDFGLDHIAGDTPEGLSTTTTPTHHGGVDQGHQEGGANESPGGGRKMNLRRSVMPPVLMDVRRGLSSVACDHLHRVLAQLLAAEEVPEIPTWLPIIQQLAIQASLLLSPTAIVKHAARGRGLDPRAYVKVKKVADYSDPATSCIVQGLVFSKNLTHRSMRRVIMSPKILLLQGALEYHRQNRLLTLDTLIPQEPEYMRNSVQKALRFKPDLILVENSVSRVAQEMLLEAGVSLAINVKHSTLDRIVQCSGARIADHVDNLFASNIAHAKVFRTEDVVLRADSSAPSTPKTQRARQPAASVATAQRKTLMYLEGPSEGTSCTLLLRGAPDSVLVRLKRVTRFAVFAAYCARLEVAYLGDVCTALAATMSPVLQGPNAVANAASATPLTLSPDDSSFAPRTWEHWATAVGQSCGPLLERPIASVSPYVKKWHMRDIQSGDPARVDHSRASSWDTTPSNTPKSSMRGAFSQPYYNSQHTLRQDLAQIYYGLWTQVSHSFRNHKRQLLCSPPTVRKHSHYGRDDMPLIKFLESCLPQKCEHCSDMSTAHIRFFMHGSQRLSVSVYNLRTSKQSYNHNSINHAPLPASSSAPSGGTSSSIHSLLRGDVWFWVRVKNTQNAQNALKTKAWKIRLSTSARCLSLGHFLELACSATSLVVGGATLNLDVVLFFRVGHCIVCMNPDRVRLFEVGMPPKPISNDSASYGRVIQHDAVSLHAEISEKFEALAGHLRRLQSNAAAAASHHTETHVVLRDNASPHTDAGAAGDGAGPNPSVNSRSATLEELLQQLEVERAFLLEKIRALSAAVTTDEDLPLHAALTDNRFASYYGLEQTSARLLTLHAGLIAARCEFSVVMYKWSAAINAVTRISHGAKSGPAQEHNKRVASGNFGRGVLRPFEGVLDCIAPGVPGNLSNTVAAVSNLSASLTLSSYSRAASNANLVALSLRPTKDGAVSAALKVLYDPSTRSSGMSSGSLSGLKSISSVQVAEALAAPTASGRARLLPTAFDMPTMPSADSIHAADSVPSKNSGPLPVVSLQVGMGPDLRELAFTPLPDEQGEAVEAAAAVAADAAAADAAEHPCPPLNPTRTPSRLISGTFTLPETSAHGGSRAREELAAASSISFHRVLRGDMPSPSEHDVNEASSMPVPTRRRASQTPVLLTASTAHSPFYTQAIAAAADGDLPPPGPQPLRKTEDVAAMATAAQALMPGDVPAAMFDTHTRTALSEDATAAMSGRVKSQSMLVSIDATEKQSSLDCQTPTSAAPGSRATEEACELADSGSPNAARSQASSTTASSLGPSASVLAARVSTAPQPAELASGSGARAVSPSFCGEGRAAAAADGDAGERGAGSSGGVAAGAPADDADGARASNDTLPTMHKSVTAGNLGLVANSLSGLRSAFADSAPAAPDRNPSIAGSRDTEGMHHTASCDSTTGPASARRRTVSVPAGLHEEPSPSGVMTHRSSGQTTDRNRIQARSVSDLAAVETTSTDSGPIKRTLTSRSESQRRAQVIPQLLHLGVKESDVGWIMSKLNGDEFAARTYTEERVLEGLGGWDTRLAGAALANNTNNNNGTVDNMAKEDSHAAASMSRVTIDNAMLGELALQQQQGQQHQQQALVQPLATQAAQAALTAKSGSVEDADAPMVASSVPKPSLLGAAGAKLGVGAARHRRTKSEVAGPGVEVVDATLATGAGMTLSTITPAKRADIVLTTPFARADSPKRVETADAPHGALSEVQSIVQASTTHALLSSVSSFNIQPRGLLSSTGRGELIDVGGEVVLGLAIPVFLEEPTTAVAHLLTTRTYHAQLERMRAEAQSAAVSPSSSLYHNAFDPGNASPAYGVGGGAGTPAEPTASPLGTSRPGTPVTPGMGSTGPLSGRESCTASVLGDPTHSSTPITGTHHGATDSFSLVSPRSTWRGDHESPFDDSSASRFGMDRFHESYPALTWPNRREIALESSDTMMPMDGASTSTSSNATRFKVTAYYPLQFAELRRLVLKDGEFGFLLALSRCQRWRPRGGKTMAFFAKTFDERFVIKQLSKSEKASFLEFAPHYFRHCADSCINGTPSCLAKVLGCYSISVRDEYTMDFIVSENIFYEKQLARTYDLKGTERSAKKEEPKDGPQGKGGAHNASHGGAGTGGAGASVLLDDQFRQRTMMKPVTVSPGERHKLMQALRSDTAFLARVGVMDYSLLLGIDRTNSTLHVGIIDYLRQYTWDKQVENWVKQTMMKGQKKEPTVISPKQYMKRFRAAMESYFTVVPFADKLPAEQLP